jgi:hypothetical protein
MEANIASTPEEAVAKLRFALNKNGFHNASDLCHLIPGWNDTLSRDMGGKLQVKTANLLPVSVGIQRGPMRPRASSAC